MTTHTTHPDVTKRLKRAQSHLKSILGMQEEGRGCLEIAQQLQAVEKAISSAKRALVHDHIEHCLEGAVREGAVIADETISEFKEITKTTVNGSLHGLACFVFRFLRRPLFIYG